MKINKIINSPDRMVPEMLEGYLSLYGHRFEKVEGTFGGMIKKEPEDKVHVLIAGGAGNEPWCLGYVGEGMADAMVSGNVYAAPSALDILDVCRRLKNGKGIMLLGTNHMGDVLNFELVKELAHMEGIQAEAVFVNDDVGSDLYCRAERRGVAGIVLAVQIAGAASIKYDSLHECAEITRKAIENMATLGVTTSPGYMPANGREMCHMEEGMIEYGMGFNGEPGFLSCPLVSAGEMAETIISKLLDDLSVTEEEVVLLVNGFGFTSHLELFIIVKEVREILVRKQIRVYDISLSNAFCPQGTGGFSITMMKMTEELRKLYDYGADSPLYRREK